MGTFDLAVTIIFSGIALGSLAGAIWCITKALRVSGERDGDLKMFFWSVGALITLIIAGLSAAYILIPMFLAYN